MTASGGRPRKNELCRAGRQLIDRTTRSERHVELDARPRRLRRRRSCCARRRRSPAKRGELGPQHGRDLSGDVELEQARPAALRDVLSTGVERDEPTVPERLWIARLRIQNLLEHASGVAAERPPIRQDLCLGVRHLELVVGLRGARPGLAIRLRRFRVLTENDVAACKQQPAIDVVRGAHEPLRELAHEACALVCTLLGLGVPIGDVSVQRERDRNDRDGCSDTEHGPMTRDAVLPPQRPHQNSDRERAKQRCNDPKLVHATSSSSSGWLRRTRKTRQNTNPPSNSRKNGAPQRA